MESQMELRPTNLLKILLLILIIFQAGAQTTPKPVKKEVPDNTELNTKVGTKPKVGSTDQTKTARTLEIPKKVDPLDVRKTNLDPDTQLEEDSLRLAAEEEILADQEKNKLRKRIFGYSYFNTTKFNPTPVLNIPTPNNYVLGTNDQLIIDLYGIYQDRFTTTVSPDGYVRIDKGGIGLIYVSGLSIEQAKDRIKNRMIKSYVALGGANPQATLSISLGNIRSIKVNVLGEVVSPGTYTMPSLATILNVLYQCGGPNEIGSFRKIQLIRQNRVVANFDFYDVLLNGFSKQNLLLQDQDILKIPPYQNRVIIQGAVKRSQIFELEPNENLDKLIEYAGGFNPKAYTNKLNVHRNTEKDRKIVGVEKADFAKFKIADGDSVVVNQLLERYENRVNIEGSVFRPGEYSITENKTLSDLIKSAEGLKEDALTGRISIERTNADLSIENISVNFAEVLNGRATDVQLQREDLITVKSIFDITELSVVRIQGAINNEDAEIGIEFPFVRNMTIEDLIVRSGGLKESAALARVEVVRRKRNVDPTTANAQVSDIFPLTVSSDFKLNSKDAKFVLMPFDEIFVRNSPNYQTQKFVEIEGEIIYPGRYGIKTKDEKISDLVSRSGGITPLAYTEGATLIRIVKLSEIEVEQRKKSLRDINQGINAKGEDLNVAEVALEKPESIGIDLRKILDNPGSDADMFIQDGDILKIPKRLETVRIQGEVLYPITVKYHEGSGMDDYISSAGGFTNRSIRRKTFVLYANGSVQRTRKFLVFNIYPKIEPGSEIIIPSKGAPLTPVQSIQRLQAVVGTITGTITGLLSLWGIISVTRIGKTATTP